MTETLQIGPLELYYRGDGDHGEIDITLGETIYGGLDYVTHKQWQEIKRAAAGGAESGEVELPAPPPLSRSLQADGAEARDFWSEHYSV